jgi:hypothetical protein
MREDAGEEDLDDDIDCMYDAADGEHGQLENAYDGHTETGESTDAKTNVFQGKDFTGAGHLPTLLEQDTSQLYWSRTPPNFVRARRQNIIVHLPGCVDETKNANTTRDTFSFFISDYILDIIVTRTNQKN